MELVWKRTTNVALVAAATLALAACSANTPTTSSAPPASLPSVSPSTGPTGPTTSPPPAASVYAVPPALVGELARIVYVKPGTVDGANVVVPAGRSGYFVDFGCTAADPAQEIGFELLHGSTKVASGTENCDGTDHKDTAVVAGAPAETLHLELTGNLSGVSAAYAVVAPSQPS